MTASISRERALVRSPGHVDPFRLLTSGIPLTLLLDLLCCPDSQELYRREPATG
ncbi:MAG: hypothetical protein ACYCO3_16365 [Mycobacteriales bacterium]